MWFLAKNYDKIIPHLIETRDAKKLLLIAQTEGDETVISRAALALGELGDSSVAKSLLYVLQRRSHRNKTLNTDLFEPAIVEALKRIGPSVIPDLIFEISYNTIKEDWKIRNAAENAVIGMGKSGISAFLDLLRKPDTRTKEIAIRLLSRAITEAYESYAFTILKRDYPKIAEPMIDAPLTQKAYLSTLKTQPGFVFDESFCMQAIGERLYLETISALRNALTNFNVSESARKALSQITIENPAI